MNNKEDIESKIFFSKYKPEKKIGEGSFGKIYSAININTNEKFALKLEHKINSQNLLESEAYVLCYLKGAGIPFVKSYGFSGDWNILVMELLDKSLEDYFQMCNCKFSLKTVCMLADQMISRIEYIHTKHIIHRDIKPDNFVMGLGEISNVVYLIDFGLAKKYRSSRTLQHIKFTNNKKLTGTARYASINALRGTEQSRRDDLEAIGYVLMYFLRGSLPWQGLKVDRKEDRYRKIYEKKKSTTAEELCVGFPSEFKDYINYTRKLGFEEEPNYDYLRGLFKKIMEENGLEYDCVFDWVKEKKSDMKFLQNTNVEKPLKTSMDANLDDKPNNNNLGAGANMRKFKDEEKFLEPETNNNILKTNLNLDDRGKTFQNLGKIDNTFGNNNDRLVTSKAVNTYVNNNDERVKNSFINDKDEKKDHKKKQDSDDPASSKKKKDKDKNNKCCIL